MRRLLGLFVSLILLCSLCAACCSANVLNKPLVGPELARLTDNDTVALVYSSKTSEDGTTFPFCTGVWVSQDVILTAGHCAVGLAKMESAEQVILLLQDLLAGKDPGNDSIEPVKPIGLTAQFILRDEATDLGKEPTNTHDATIFALYRHMDLALLRVKDGEKLHHGVAKLASERPERGEQLAFDGHVDKNYWTFRTGTVAAYREDMSSILDGETKELEGPFMQVSAPVSFGDSGGGAFNERGELVGILSFISTGSPDTGFCVPLETIRSVLQTQKVIPMVLNLDPTAPDPKEYRLKKE